MARPPVLDREIRTIPDRAWCAPDESLCWPGLHGTLRPTTATSQPSGVAVFIGFQHITLMTNKFHDALMRGPIICFTLFFVVRGFDGLRTLIGSHPSLDGDIAFLVNLAARISVIEFLLLLVVFHLVRHRPLKKFDAWTPKVTAMLGLTLSLAVLLLPRAAENQWFDGASAALVLAGNTMCILTLMTLGRSISIMPEARELVVEGMYRRIRHPLYLAEEIALVGVFLQFRSWPAATVLVVHLLFQLGRIHWEEKILVEAFPQYQEYRRGTWRLIPGIY